MPATSDKINHLRQLLPDRCVRGELGQEFYVTGVPALDEAGIPEAALTEMS